MKLRKGTDVTAYIRHARECGDPSPHSSKLLRCLDREVFFGFTRSNQAGQPTWRQAAATPSFAVRTAVFSRYHLTGFAYGCFALSTCSFSSFGDGLTFGGSAFAGLQVFDSDTKCVHFGEYVLHGFIKLAGLDVASLFLQFFNLILNIN